ncbi:hypothetical protein GUITHDRAFT_57398, partial [Guillardia theta CCMP2712]
VACGGQHSALITKDGELVTWGNSDRGQCGHDTFRSSQVPRLIRSLREHYVMQVACGESHTLILTSTSQVLSCGLAAYGALGHGDGEDCCTPRVIGALWSLPVVQIAAGENHSAAVVSTGEAHMWGLNKHGQLGLRAEGGRGEISMAEINQAMLSTLNVKLVACGGNHSVFLCSDLKVYSCGMGSKGQLGHGSRRDEHRPRRVERLEEQEISEVSCGYEHTLFRDSSGVLFVCGSNEYGQLFLGSDHQEALTPVEISA